MYQHGQHAGFPTPTTGSDFAGSTAAKASRALFTQALEDRISSSLEMQQRQDQQDTDNRGYHSQVIANQTWACAQPTFSDLTKEDLQELWRYTSVFPFITTQEHEDQPTGCESEVQQQQLACQAYLLPQQAPQGCQQWAHSPTGSHRQQAESASRFGNPDGPDNLNTAQGPIVNRGYVSIGHHPHSTSGRPCHPVFDYSCGQHRPARAHMHIGSHIDHTHHSFQAAHTHQHRQALGSPQGTQQVIAQCPNLVPLQTHGGSEHVHSRQSPSGLVSFSAPPAGTMFSAYVGDSWMTHADQGSHVGISRLGLGAVRGATPHVQRQLRGQHLAPSCCNPQISAKLGQQGRAFQHLPKQAGSGEPDFQQGSVTQQTKAFQHAMAVQQGHQYIIGLETGLGSQAARDVQDALLHARASEQTRAFQNCPKQAGAGEASPQQGSITQQGKVAQQGRAVQHAKSAQHGPQQTRAIQRDMQPARASQRLGQKRKQAALLAPSCFAPDDTQKASAVVNHTQAAMSSSQTGATSGLQASKHSAEPTAKHARVEAAGDTGQAVLALLPPSPRLMTPVDPPDSPVLSASEPMANFMRGSIRRSHSPSDDSTGTSYPLHKRTMTDGTPIMTVEDVDLLADASEVLGLSPGRPEMQDDPLRSPDYDIGFQDDLVPADPSEGLAIPSWYELLDEAASQLTPQGFPRTCPALTDNPAPPRRQSLDAVMIWESSRQPSWVPNQCPAVTSSEQLDLSTAFDADVPMQHLGCELGFRQQLRQDEPSSERVTVAGAMCTDGHTQDRDNSRSFENESLGKGAQQTAHVAVAVVVQKPKRGQAKHAKRGATTGKKQRQTQGRGHSAGQDMEQPLPAGQGQTAGQGRVQGQPEGLHQKQHAASLGKLLPFDMLQGTAMEGGLAELNSRIQATTVHPQAGGTAVAMPVYHFSRPVQQGPPSEGFKSPFAFVEENRVSLMQPASAVTSYGLDLDSCSADAQTDIMGHAGDISSSSRGAMLQRKLTLRCGEGAVNGAVQLVKLSGTTNFGWHADL